MSTDGSAEMRPPAPCWGCVGRCSFCTIGSGPRLKKTAHWHGDGLVLGYDPKCSQCQRDHGLSPETGSGS